MSASWSPSSLTRRGLLGLAVVLVTVVAVAAAAAEPPTGSRWPVTAGCTSPPARPMT